MTHYWPKKNTEKNRQAAIMYSFLSDDQNVHPEQLELTTTEIRRIPGRKGSIWRNPDQASDAKIASKRQKLVVCSRHSAFEGSIAWETYAPAHFSIAGLRRPAPCGISFSS